MSDAEIKRNPHPDFKAVEASRPPWDGQRELTFTQTAAPGWAFGDGANDKSVLDKAHVAIDPHAPGRPPSANYKLLISAVVPRPIAFVSTRSADGAQTNLAPFSYFQMVAHDPPLFVIGFATPLDRARSRDSLRHLVDTGECVVNLISEAWLEAANAASVDAPRDASEWDLTGLHPAYDCETVACARVREAAFAVECRLDSVREVESRSRPGSMSGTVVTVEGTRFWAREDAINEERNLLDNKITRPVSRLGGITYGRVLDAIEIPRPTFAKDVGGREGYEKLAKKIGAGLNGANGTTNGA